MQDIDLLISGGRVLTLDPEDREIPTGAVAVNQGAIVAVGPAEELMRCYAGRETIDASDCLVLPGLVNGHTHAAMTCYRGIGDDMDLMDWLEHLIFPAESRTMDREAAYWGSLLAMAEMIRSGTTTFSDMYYFEDETAQAAKQAGMRCILGEALIDFPAPNAKSPEAGLAYTRWLLEKWAGDPLVSIMVEPHSLYTCSPPLLLQAKRLADEYQTPLAMHLLENKAEAKQIKEKLGQRATAFLREQGVLNERFVAFHGVCLDDDDIRLLADHGCKVVHNPESNMKLASGVAPITAMMTAGITVGIGTDGCASNNNLDLFQEMDSAAKLEKAVRHDPTIMSAQKVLRMATCDGAQVYGLDQRVGVLRPGAAADILLVDLRKPHLTPLYNASSHLVYAVNGSDVDTVVIQGRVVMRKRKLLTIDEEEAMDHVRRIAEKVRRTLSA